MTLQETLAYLNAFLSLLAVIGLVFSALGWRHSLRSEDYSPEWFFAMAKVLMAAGIGFRMLFWDVIWGSLYIIDKDYASTWSEAFGRTNVNLVSSIILLFGVYCSLKARQLVLQQDRGINWHWSIAWAYPRAKTIIKIMKERRYR